MIPTDILRTADILRTMAARRPDYPVYTVWNALVIYIPEDQWMSAVERYADALVPDWRTLCD
jgi:hypothetical protein